MEACELAAALMSSLIPRLYYRKKAGQWSLGTRLAMHEYNYTNKCLGYCTRSN